MSSKQCSHLPSQRLMIAVVSGTRPNVFAERFSRERSGLRAEPVVKAAGGELLGGTLYELAPRYEGVPLHIHLGMEELAIVISGRPTLRTLEGESELAPGDIVAFPRGRRDGHLGEVIIDSGGSFGEQCSHAAEPDSAQGSAIAGMVHRLARLNVPKSLKRTPFSRRISWHSDAIASRR